MGGRLAPSVSPRPGEGRGSLPESPSRLEPRRGRVPRRGMDGLAGPAVHLVRGPLRLTMRLDGVAVLGPVDLLRPTNRPARTRGLGRGRPQDACDCYEIKT